MSRVQKLRVFVTQRLDAAVEEILAVFEKTVVKYEQEAALCQEVISRQHALLCALNKPLMDVPSAGAFSKQLLVTDKVVSPEDQDPSPVKEEEGGQQQLQDLDEADIIQFTYNARRAVKPEPGAAGSGPDVLLVSSETEDSDDYNRDCAGPGPASDQPRPGPGRRPGGGLKCRVCNRTFRARRVCQRHIRAHLREAEPVCGLCGERFDAVETLRLHFQTHQTRTQSTKTKLQTDNPEPDPKVPTCEDCGETFLQVWKKRRHQEDQEEEEEGPQSPAMKPKT